MAYKLVIKPLAELDIAESYQWYDEKLEGLGDDFLNELERSLELIKTNPHQDPQFTFQFSKAFGFFAHGAVPDHPYISPMLALYQPYIPCVWIGFRKGGWWVTITFGLVVGCWFVVEASFVIRHSQFVICFPGRFTSK